MTGAEPHRIPDAADPAAVARRIAARVQRLLQTVLTVQLDDTSAGATLRWRAFTPDEVATHLIEYGPGRDAPERAADLRQLITDLAAGRAREVDPALLTAIASYFRARCSERSPAR